MRRVNGLKRTAGRLRWPAWIAICLGVAAWSAPRADWARIRMRYANTAAVETLGYSGYALFDVVDTVTGLWRRAALRSVDPAPYRAYLEQVAATRTAMPEGAHPGKNVILIQMESVDGLAIGSRSAGRPLMPFLEDLGRRGVYFANVVNNTATGRTTDAELLVLTSQVPLRRPPAYVSEPLSRVPSLPRVLKAAGYHSFSMHGYQGSFWRRQAAHEALGFDEAFFEDRLEPAEHIGWGISDRAVLHAAAGRIIASRAPVFAHVILLTNHHPYGYVGEAEGRPKEPIEAAYVRSLRYVDRSIEGFFVELQEAGVLSHSIIAVFGDHDSAITGRLRLFLESVPHRVVADSVPLIVVGLDHPPGEVGAVAGLQDLPVLIAEDLGIRPPLTFTGHDFAGLGSTVAAKYGAVRGAPQGLERIPSPVSQEVLTRLALNYPEKLMAP